MNQVDKHSNTLTYSSTSIFKTCRKKYFYLYWRKLEPIEKPLYFSVGSAFHKALELHYQGKDASIILAAIDSYFNSTPPDSDDIEKVTQWQTARHLTRKMFTNYLKTYPSESFKVINTELKFSVPIINPITCRNSKKFHFRGIIDALVEENGQLWIMEHKTTSSISPQYIRGLTLDTQSIAYIEALERFLNIKISGIIYNVCLKSVPRKPKILKNGKFSCDKSQNTTYEIYLKSILEDNQNPDEYQDILDFLQSHPRRYFYREYLVFPQETICEWQQELWDIAKDISHAEKENRWYKNTFQCTLRGTCMCYEICTATDQEWVIENQFKENVYEHMELEETSEEKKVNNVCDF